MAIIYLYDSTVTDFTYNGQPLNKAYEVVVDNIINDSFFVTFNHPLDDKGIYKIIEKDKIVKVHTPDGMQPFRIMDRVKYMDHISVEAWPLFYADMRNKLVKPLIIRGLTGQAAMNMFVNNLLIDTPFTFTSNITDTHDYHTQDSEERENNPNQLYNALDVFKDIVKRWQGELVINGYDIRVVSRLGRNTGALLYEKKNISDFTDEESIQDITTRLYGKSEWTERPEGSNQEIKHKISVKVESPLINAYSGIVFEKQYTNNDIRTEKEMKDWLNLKFTTDNIDKPSRNIKVGTNIVDDTSISLGDKLVLKYIKHDVDMEIRMVGYTYDGYANRYIDIQLGDAKDSYVGNVQNTVRELETNVGGVVKQTVNQILNANGERMIYSVNEPVGNFKNGDVWFDQQGGMYMWDEASSMWIDHPYNRNMNVIGDKIENEIKPAINQMTTNISNASNMANDALDKVGLNTSLIEEHKKRLDGLRVGGRNLIKDSDKVYTRTNSSSLAIDGINIDDLVDGEDYTFSFDIRSTTATYIESLFINSSINKLIPNSPISNEWTRLSATFKWIEGSNYRGDDLRPHFYPRDDYSGATEVRNIKLEKGNVATDWTPALEDFDAEFNSVSGEITQMRKDLSTVSDTAQSSLNIIGIDSGNMYTKNRRLGAKSQTIPKGDTAEILHNGDGFEVGKVYTLSFKAECIQEILTSDVVFEFDTLKSDIVFEFSEAKADIEFIIQNALDTLNIVHLGDSIIMGYGRDVTVPMVESDKLDADVINGGFGGTMANLHPNAEFAKISFVNLADSIATGDFSLQENMKLPELSTAQNKAYMDTVDRIKATDFNSTDALIISYGVNDWTDGTPIDNSNNPKDKETYLGALRYGIDRIKAKYPHLQIMLTQPIFWSDPATGLTSENRRNSKGNLLPEFAQALDTLGAELGIPVAQTHYGTGMNSQNKDLYFYSYDGTHPNDAGNVLLGETIANEFIRLVDFDDLQAQPSRQVSEVTFDFGENY